MAHWKYHIESGDAVSFKWEYKGATHRCVGTITGIEQPDDLPDKPTADDIDLEEIHVQIASGTSRERVMVPVADLIDRTPKDERETDLPILSERLRLGGNTVSEVKRRHERPNNINSDANVDEEGKDS
jgi:hypothetical protein